MTARNDITGDPIASRSSAAYRDNWDAIFGNKKEEPELPEVTNEEILMAKVAALRDIVEKAAAHVRPTCQDLYDELVFTLKVTE